jgi:sugar phosphate isomerase/epimerase
MNLALSTRWNARRHRDGAAMIDEILAAGFRAVELSYDLRRDLLAGVEARVAEGAVAVTSLHNYCPVPMGVPRGHPELWTFASDDPAIRRKAVEETINTIRLAGSLKASVVVVHAGYVAMRNRTRRLIGMAERGKIGSWWWTRVHAGALKVREKKAPPALARLRDCLAQIEPVLRECGVRLGIENLPSWEAVPTETELAAVLSDLGSDRFRYWHDFGHGQIRENLGFINHLRLLERMKPWIGGFHVHDVRPPADDHVLPPEGMIDFSEFREFASLDVPKVIEPGRDAPVEALRTAVRHLRETWAGAPDR